MERGPLVLDISSDEEEEEEEGKARLEEKGERRIDLAWINEFLDMSDEESNKVVVANKSQHKSKSSTSTALAVKSVDDDDDCVVLDGDPENRVNSVDDSPTGSDELLVVGEKGQIACRDYPHARYLCAKFPYSSTPHEKHCDQCHCYVCDSLAPCLKWGNGLSSTDHCHATDKSEIWKTLRTTLRLGKTTPLPPSTDHCTLGDVRNPQHNYILPLDIRLLSPNSALLNQTSRSIATPRYPQVNLIPQNEASWSVIMHTYPSLNSNLPNQVTGPNTAPQCSMATNFTIQYGANHGRYQESRSTLARNRYQSHSVPRQYLGVRNHTIQRVRGRGASSLGPQLLHSHMIPTVVGNVGVGSTLAMNHSTNGASGFPNHVNSAHQYERYLAATGLSNNRNCYGQSNILVPKNVWFPHPSTEQNNLSSFSNYTKAYETQGCYQSNGSQNFYAHCVQGNEAPPSSNVACLNRNQALNELQMGTENENGCGNIIQCGTTIEYSCQQKPHDQSQSEFAMKADFSAFDSSWVEDTNQSISCIQSSGSINISPGAKEISTQVTGSTNLGSVDDIKQWLFGEENSTPVGANGALASELNMPSPDLSTFDEGMFLFDFENNWNCPAHV